MTHGSTDGGVGVERVPAAIDVGQRCPSGGPRVAAVDDVRDREDDDGRSTEHEPLQDHATQHRPWAEEGRLPTREPIPGRRIREAVGGRVGASDGERMVLGVEQMDDGRRSRRDRPSRTGHR